MPASISTPHRPKALQPFERRFSSRLSPSPLNSPRAISPAFLTPHSRQSSLSSQLLLHAQDQDEAETPQPPWEVVRWTKLKTITGQIFSEVGRRKFGQATCLSVGASIVVGTSKGFILVFDYHQTMKSIIGPGTEAVECGRITALAISADHTTVAGGHATGHIFTWELARPTKPFLHIAPLDRSTLTDKRVDGHVLGAAVLHVGFLGTRHTALVSADEGGMAFSHLATRGLGAVGRTVKTTRLLGRYPEPSVKPRKASSVLAFSSLPLGNVEQSTDSMGLTALLTPYLLVIVSTTPVARTQHKAARPKELAPHGTLSGCLAWFPAVRLKQSPDMNGDQVSRTKLVYSWSNVLTVLEVEATDNEERDTPPELHFHPRSRWRSDEAIVAVQWLSRSVLAVLTISQRLVILEDPALRVTDSFDLLHKHIFHQDLFSKQLQPVVEQLDDEDTSMHGVVADAFHMSFRAYKGRLFLLGFNDVAIGTLSNWADRLLALMDEGDYIAAINLATSYYVGDAEKLSVGLPANDEARHVMVQEKLLGMITASLKYTFRRIQGDHEDEETRTQLKELASAVFAACLGMSEIDFLFEDVYEAFEEASAEDVFFDTLEPFIIGEEITAVPPDPLKGLITHFASQGHSKRLEEIICRLEAQTMDIDQVTSLCKQFGLYDALIYVWNQALLDYVTPLIELLSLIKMIGIGDQQDEAVAERYMPSAMKLFPYLAYSLTGRVYPRDVQLDEHQGMKAKSDLYGYLFAGRLVRSPDDGEPFATKDDRSEEPPFPYLCLVLRFDTGSFMSMLNEAFEDSYLDGEDAAKANGTANPKGLSSYGPNVKPTRQYIINILLGVMQTEEFAPEDVIYFYMFLARNLPKYPQYVMLPGSSLHRVLVGLCKYPTEEVADDCQLSVEYLLSVYHPPDLESLVPLFEEAGFHRVLRSVFKHAKKYARLIEEYLNDTEEQDAVFECIADSLRPSQGLNEKQRRDVEIVIVNHAHDLAAIDPVKTAQTIQQYARSLLQPVLHALEAGSFVQYQYLNAILEPTDNARPADSVRAHGESTSSEMIEHYVQLMCKFNRSHVADYVGMIKSGDLRLDQVLPAIEESGVVDAAVVLMAREGMVRQAMDRLIKHLETLEGALTGILNAAAENPDTSNTEEAATDLLDQVNKYLQVGLWLCRGQTRAYERSNPALPRRLNQKDPSEDDLEMHELLWLDLVDTIVTLSKHVSAAAADLGSDLDTTNIVSTTRSTVQQTFSALLAATATTSPVLKSANQTAKSTSKPSSPKSNPSFLLIFRLFLSRAATSSPTLSDLRAVLSDIFSAYTFEQTLLNLSSSFLDKDAFAQVHEANERRQRGWRPRQQVCEGCRRRVWGPGAGAGVWEAWERREKKMSERRRTLQLQRSGGEEAERLARGKGRIAAETTTDEDEDEEEEGVEGDAAKTQKENLGPLLVFACRHTWHRTCLQRALTLEKQKGEEGSTSRERERLRCPLETA